MCCPAWTIGDSIAEIVLGRRRHGGDGRGDRAAVAVVAGDRRPVAAEHADQADLVVDPEGVDRLLRRRPVVEVDRRRGGGGEDVGEALRLLDPGAIVGRSLTGR